MARLSDNQRLLVCGLLALLGVVVFAAWPITCPYCHNSNANVKGACVKRQRDGYCNEDYYPTPQFVLLV
jgi:hypothetical protein